MSHLEDAVVSFVRDSLLPVLSEEQHMILYEEADGVMIRIGQFEKGKWHKTDMHTMSWRDALQVFLGSSEALDEAKRRIVACRS